MMKTINHMLDCLEGNPSMRSLNRHARQPEALLEEGLLLGRDYEFTLQSSYELVADFFLLLVHSAQLSGGVVLGGKCAGMQEHGILRGSASCAIGRGRGAAEKYRVPLQPLGGPPSWRSSLLCFSLASHASTAALFSTRSRSKAVSPEARVDSSFFFCRRRSCVQSSLLILPSVATTCRDMGGAWPPHHARKRRLLAKTDSRPRSRKQPLLRCVLGARGFGDSSVDSL